MAPTTRAQKKTVPLADSDPFAPSSPSPQPGSLEGNEILKDPSPLPVKIKRGARQPLPAAERVLRMGNQKHPGRAAGVEKKTRSDVAAAADMKRAAREKVKADKDAAVAKKKQEKDLQLAEIAQIQDQRQDRDRREEISIARAPAFLYGATDAKEDSGSGDTAEESQDIDDEEEIELTEEQKQAQAEWAATVAKRGSRLKAKAKAQTAAEKKESRIQSDRAQVAAARKKPAVPTKRKTPTSKVDVRTDTKKAKTSVGLLLKDWCTLVGLKGVTTVTPKRAQAQRQQTPSDHDLLSDVSDDATGFNDESVMITEDAVLRLSAKKPLELVVSDLVSDDDNVNPVFKKMPTVGAPPPAATERTVRKTKPNHLPSKPTEKLQVTPARTSKAMSKATGAMHTPLSTALSTLPEWAQNDFQSRFVPTLLALLGAQDDVWSLETLPSLAQQAADIVWPEQQYDMKLAGNPMCRRARQAVYDWRSSVGSTAVKAVQVAAAAIPRSKRAAWATSALRRDYGEAFWANPDANGPTGSLRSRYIIEVFAVYFKVIVGSEIESESYPAGTLALSVAAVERAFKMYTSGEFVQGPKFTMDNYGTTTTDWLMSVALLLRKPKRVTALTNEVLALIESQTHRAVAVTMDNVGGLIVAEASSPPSFEDDAEEA
ncbi:hypothetical protein DENSPDRAFT_927925 [Dentipellis sp. KUC8613]|nr:hypothetical protein DENSPDRAFT_927925 [Dentipellis sp. KUC8613]